MADWTTPSAIHSKCGESSPEVATNTIDENTGSQWGHYVTEYHWIIFDMGTTKNISQVRLWLYDLRFGKDIGIKVYVSDDPANMGTAVWEGLTTGWNEWNYTGTFSKNGRYIKLESKSDYTHQLIYEFDALAGVISGIAYAKTVSEILGLVDAKSSKTAFHKTTSEVLGLVDDYDKNRCKKCKPSVTLTF